MSAHCTGGPHDGEIFPNGVVDKWSAWVPRDLSVPGETTRLDKQLNASEIATMSHYKLTKVYGRTRYYEWKEVDNIPDKFQDPVSFTEFFTALKRYGANWEQLWERAHTDSVFEELYSDRRLSRPMFIYNSIDGPILFVFDDEAEDGERWTFYAQKDIVVWLVGNPPHTQLVAIASLYFYASGMEAGANPWLLFQYVTGIAKTSQGMGLNSLMGIGSGEARYLGKALVAYSDNDQDVENYVELLLDYGGE